MIDLGDGKEVPARIDRLVSNKALPYDVALTLTFQQDRFELAALKFHQKKGGDPVTGVALRTVPVDRLVRRVMSEWLPPRKKSRFVRRAEVAAVYRLAYALHLPPTKTVTERLGMSYSTVERAVASARADGLLPDTEQGKAKG